MAAAPPQSSVVCERIEGQGQGTPRAAIVGELKARVIHPQRLPHLPQQMRAQPLAGHLFDHQAQHVGGKAVLKGGAGLVSERQPGDPVDETRCIIGKHHLARTRPERGRRTKPAASIGDTRGVSQQIVNENGALLRLKGESATTIVQTHLHVAKGRKPAVHAAAQRQASGLHELEGRHTDHDLGHRGQWEHRIQRHGHAGHRVARAIGAVMNQPALTGDRQDRAGQALGRNLARKEGVDGSDACGTDAMGLGVAGRQGVCGHEGLHSQGLNNGSGGGLSA